MKNTTNKNLMVVGALALLLVAGRASAYVPEVWDPQYGMYNDNGAPMTTVIRSSYDPYVQPQVAVQPIYMRQPSYASYTYQAPYQYQANPAPLASPLTTQYVAPVQRTEQAPAPVSAPVSRVQSVRTNVVERTVPPAKTIDTTAQMFPVVTSDQGASAFYGSGSFMPGTLLGWFLVILLILAIIILARKIAKHNHDVHTVQVH